MKEWKKPELTILDVKATKGGGADWDSPDDTYMTDASGKAWRGYDPLS